MPKLLKLTLALAGLTLLAGCGKGASKSDKPAVKADVGIFISATDCAESGKLTVDECGKAIDKAIAAHEKQAPTFKTIGQCAAKLGNDRCTPSVDGSYRARVQAFMVTMSKPPVAEPLYPPATKTVGFNSLAGKPVNAKDDTMIVSPSAMAVASDNNRLKASK